MVKGGRVPKFRFVVVPTDARDIRAVEGGRATTFVLKRVEAGALAMTPGGAKESEVTGSRVEMTEVCGGQAASSRGWRQQNTFWGRWGDPASGAYGQD